MPERFPLVASLVIAAWAVLLIGVLIGATITRIAADSREPRPPALCKPAARASTPTNALPYLVAPVFRRP